MQAKIRWLDGVSFVAESGSGHAIVLDGAPENGGRNIGSRPMELVLMGLGSCAAFDVAMILRKARQRFTDIQVELKAERANAMPAVFTDVNMIFVITGSELDQAVVARAVRLSAEKYCSVAAMLKAGGVTIQFDFVVKDSTGINSAASTK